MVLRSVAPRRLGLDPLTDDGTRIAFQKVSWTKAGKNRLQVDFVAKDEDGDRERDRGDRRHALVSDDLEDPCIVLADPEATSSASCTTIG